MRLHPLVRAELEGCGRVWRVEVGKKHCKLLIDDQFVTILPRGAKAEDNDQHKVLNARGHIRRFLKGQK